MKAILQFAKNAVAQARLPDRWERVRLLPDSAARRETLRKLLAELAPHLERETELALAISTELLAGQTEFADWEAVERLADRWPGNHRALDQALSRAAGKSTDSRALPLLLRLGEAHPNDSLIQVSLGRALLKQETCADGTLPALARVLPFLPGPERAALEKVLEPLLAVGLDSSDAELQQAESVATRFLHSAADLRGVARVLGLAALRLGDDSPESLDRADNYFSQALALDPEDAAAREGRQRAWLKCGRHDLSPGMAGGDGGAVAALQKTLAWLEGEGDEPEPPLSAAQLEQEDVPAAAAWHRDFAVARLRLIEGDNAGAVNLLKQVTEQDPDLGRVAYYAAWADLLTTGLRDPLEDRLEEYQEWAGAWTLLARVWDADPTAAHNTCDYVMGGADPDFAALLRARRALALDEEVPPAPARPGHYLEEDLEAFRIRLGQACVRGDATGVASRLAQPLFRLLPKADRLFWQGMKHCLAGATEPARGEFSRAAELGHRRAAWAMSVLCAQRGDLTEATTWSQQALANRHDARGQLWRRWLAAASGDRVAQSEIAAGSGRGKRAAQAGAYFAVAQADVAMRSGQPEEAKRLVEQALAAFKSTHPGERPAPDAALMGACLQFWLNPQRGAPALSSHWNQAVVLSPSPRRNWLMWLVILAKLARNDPRQTVETAAALRQLLRESGPLSDSVRGALARSLASVIQNATSATTSEHWLAVLQEFPGDALASEQRLAVAASAWRRCTDATGSNPLIAQELERESAADRANSLLALISAYAQLRSGESRTAADILRQSVQSGGPSWVGVVGEALPELEPGEAMARLGSLELDLHSATGLLLRALGVFRGGERVTGFDLVLQAWRLRPDKVPGIFNISRWVAVVCAGTNGKPPPQLLASVRELAAGASDPQELDRLAHCAAVLNNAALARELWARAVGHSTEARSFDRTDFARYLCHQASIEARASRLDHAATLVREAAAQLPANAAGGAP